MKKSELKELIKDVIREFANDEYIEDKIIPDSMWKIGNTKYTLVFDGNINSWVFSAIDGSVIKKFDGKLKKPQVVNLVKKMGGKLKFKLSQ